VTSENIEHCQEYELTKLMPNVVEAYQVRTRRFCTSSTFDYGSMDKAILDINVQ
jgi:hypothetical protein